MKKLILVLLTVGLVFSLYGCASGPELVDGVHTRSTLKHAQYLEAQLAAIEAQKPTFELEAQEGQTIVLAGVKSIRVYGSQNVSEIKPYVSPGYALARDLTQMLVFPLTGLAMFSEAVRSAGTAIEPNFAPTEQPFVPPTVNPFVLPVAP
jgi:predicted PurR-regulated permease PerM